MAGKPGFMVYHKDFRALDKLNDASFHRVFRAACEYSETGDVSEELDGAEAIVFELLRNRLDEDDRKYRKRVEAGRNGGLKSGEARRNVNIEATRSNAKQIEANRSKRTNTNSNTNSNTISLSERGGAEGEREIIYPDAEEVKRYADAAGLAVNAEAFVAVNEGRGWRDNNGQPIRDWQTWLQRSPMARMKGLSEDRPTPTALNFQQRTYAEGELDFLFDRFRDYTGGTDGAETDGDV